MENMDTIDTSAPIYGEYMDSIPPYIDCGQYGQNRKSIALRRSGVRIPSGPLIGAVYKEPVGSPKTLLISGIYKKTKKLAAITPPVFAYCEQYTPTPTRL